MKNQVPPSSTASAARIFSVHSQGTKINLLFIFIIKMLVAHIIILILCITYVLSVIVNHNSFGQYCAFVL